MFSFNLSSTSGVKYDYTPIHSARTRFAFGFLLTLFIILSPSSLILIIYHCREINFFLPSDIYLTLSGFPPLISSPAATLLTFLLAVTCGSDSWRDVTTPPSTAQVIKSNI